MKRNFENEDVENKELLPGIATTQAAKEKPATIAAFPSQGLVRLAQIIGNKKQGKPAFIPVSKSTWWAGVKSGRYPQPVKLSKRCTAWRVEDIRALVDQLSKGEVAA